MESNEPVYLTKNGHGSMVLLSLEQYAALSEGIEFLLDEADKEAASTDIRYTHDEVFSKVRKRINAGE